MRQYTQLLRAAVTASLMLVAIAGAAVAGPMEDGEAARDRKDYATALRLFRSLAEQGDATAQEHLGAKALHLLGLAMFLGSILGHVTIGFAPGARDRQRAH
jgi:TPR repeat protein